MTRSVHRSLELTSRGKILLLLLCLGGLATWLTGDLHSRLAASLLLAPLVIDFALKPRRLDHLRIEAPFRRTQVGAPFLETITLHNLDGRRDHHDLLLIEPRTSTWHGGAFLEHLAPGQRLQVLYAGRSRVRSHQLERVFVFESLYPLGFLRSQTIVKIAAEMITEPARIELDPHLVHAVQDGTPEWRDTPQVGGREFHSLREYQPGEDARSVHALRSAAMGTLVRKVERGSVPRQIGLVLDLRRPPGRTATRTHQHLEWSLSATASLIDAVEDQDLIADTLIIGGEESLSRNTREPGAREELFNWLAEASTVPWRAIPPELYDTFSGCEHCYWVPAGGHLARTEIEALGCEVTLVGTEDK